MEPHSLPLSSRPQDGYEGARNQPVTNLINQLTHIIMSRTLGARSENVGNRIFAIFTPREIVLFDNLEKSCLFWFSETIYSERLFGATECRHALSH